MKQVLVQKGEIVLEEVPTPAISENEVLIKTHYSLISTGTELGSVEASKMSLLTRARREPHNFKKALKMASQKGFLETYRIISGMLDFGTPLGYSLSGEVLAVGKNVADLKIGDFVSASGAKLANHAEVCAVPRLLVSKIPEGLDMREAASVTLGAIAMQGVRQANVHLGETVAVIGLGLIGQLTCQMLRASGCHVFGIDPDEKRLELAKKFGFKKETDIPTFGVDATIITASTDSNEPLAKAMEITRKKGTVVVVGNIGLKLDRSPWYEKEIDLKISCSYGPGRYDLSYEEDMLDYPFAYVRWTENRNMEEYLKLLGEKKVNFAALEAREFEFEEAAKAYEYLKTEKPLAVILRYSQQKQATVNKIFIQPLKKTEKDRIRLALVGAGSFTATTHLPNISKLHSRFALRAVVSKKGLTAKQFAKQYGANYCTTDFEEILKDPEIDAVLIATRHHLHASQTLAALRAGKAVFVEKPLALNQNELNDIKNFYTPNPPPSSLHPLLMLGFNRRFSPFTCRMKELTQSRKNPLVISYRVNAGELPQHHWTLGPQGGGRIIGEACHFFDFFRFLTAAPVTNIQVQSQNSDNFITTVSYADGSIATLTYTSLGSKDLPKEYAEIYCDSKVFVLDDFRNLRIHGGSGSLKTFGQEKGHRQELEAFAEGLKNGKPPIPLEEIFETTEVCFQVDEMVRNAKRTLNFERTAKSLKYGKPEQLKKSRENVLGE